MNKFIGIKQGTQQWKQFRNTIVTATDIGCILNNNPFQTRDQLLKKKITNNTSKISTPAINHGQFFEDVAKQLYEDKTKCKIFTPGLIVHPHHDWMGASPDGIIPDSHLVEFKCYYSKLITDKIPLHYWMQMQLQMEVCDYNECDFVECIFKKCTKTQYNSEKVFVKGVHKSVYWKLYDFKITRVFRDTKWFNDNLSEFKAFWDLMNSSKPINRKNKRKYDLQVDRGEPDMQNAYFYKQIDNYIVHDSIIDYFVLSKKYKQDRSLFNNQNKERKQLFVQEVLTKLNNVVIITNCGEKSTYAKCKETINHIAIKKNTLVGAVLYDTDRDIYCKYDLLMLGKDISSDLIPDTYYPIQIANRVIKLYRNSVNITNDANNKKYKARSILLNQLLENCQSVSNNNTGFVIDKTFLTTSNFIKLAYTDEMNSIVSNGFDHYNHIKNNLHRINIYNPKQSYIKLIPNMKNQNPFWQSEKKKVANKVKPLTSIWYCSISHQLYALNKNIYSYDDKKLNLVDLFKKNKVSKSQQSIIKKILDINNQSKDLILPRQFENINNWKHQPKVEFYVDFETTTLLDGDKLLYLIGLGVSVNNQWEYYSFCIDVNREDSEKFLVLEWMNKMNEIKNLHGIRQNIPTWHWSFAEKNILKYVVKKYPSIDSKINWKDLQETFQEEQIVIKGAYNYKLKSIVSALSKYKFIKSSYDNLLCENGMDAMVDGYNCYMSASRMNINIESYLQDKNIIEYNRIDCYSLFEILEFLRSL